MAFDEDFEAELSENHEARFEVSMLAQSPDREFTEVTSFEITILAIAFLICLPSSEQTSVCNGIVHQWKLLILLFFI